MRETTRADSYTVSRLPRSASICPRRDGDARGIAEPLVQIGAHFRNQWLDPVFEEVVRAGHDGMFDHGALLGFQLINLLDHFLQRRHPVEIAVDEQARTRAGGEKGEVEAVGWRGDGDKTLDLGPAHEQLHRDPRTERRAGDPAGARGRINGLDPVERGGGVGKFSHSVIETTLAAPHATEIEAQHGEPALGEGVIEIVDDLVVHRAAELRVRLQHEGDRGAARGGLVEAAFQPAGRTGENNFWHGSPNRRRDPSPHGEPGAARVFMMARPHLA